MAESRPSLLERLIKISTVEETAVFANSKILQNRDLIQTDIPLLNIALSGAVNGGLSSGVNAIAGPSKHFKSLMALLIAKAFMDKYDDAVMVLVDSEFGTLPSYVSNIGIDPNRIIHIPISTIEQARHELSVLLNEITRKDNIIFVFDSVGNLASAKETADALKGDDKTDMTRAKVMKSMFRIITPKLVIKDVPMLVINHTYQTQEMYSKTVMSGGCVLAGTMIMLADGTTKPVENFSVGDLVATMDGPKTVTHTWNPSTLEEGTPECFEVEFEDGNKVVCSDKHKFMIDETWVEAKNLSVGQDARTI